MREPTRLYLVRHGQTDLNREGRFRGLADAPLNEAGRAEAAAAARLLRGRDIELILTSPVPRSVQTAEAIAEATGAPVEVDPGFTDVDYGRWQGLTIPEASERYPREMSLWKRDPGSFRFPGGDSMAEVSDRLSAAIARAAGSGKRSVAVVSHLAVIKACFSIALGLDLKCFWSLNLDNGAVSLFEHRDGGFVLEWWNRPGDDRD